MSPGTSALPVLPDCLDLSLSLCFSSHCCFPLSFCSFRLKPWVLFLNSCVLLPLVCQDCLLPSHFVTVHTVHRLGSLLPPGSLAPCPLHIYSRGPFSDQCLPSHRFGRLLILWIPMLALFIGQGLFCLFPNRGKTEDKGREGNILSVHHCIRTCNPVCAESLTTPSSLRIFVPEDTGVTLMSWLGTTLDICTYLMSLQNYFLFTGCSGFQLDCHSQWAAFVLFLSDWVPRNGILLSLITPEANSIIMLVSAPSQLPRWSCLQIFPWNSKYANEKYFRKIVLWLLWASTLITERKCWSLGLV